IKTWLSISYLIVMLLPLLSAYILFATYVSYNNDRQVEDYFYVMSEVKQLNSVLQDPHIFDKEKNNELIEQVEAESDLQFSFYSKDGDLIYSPVENKAGKLNEQQLFEDLYELNRNFRTYEYNEPVFENDQIIGFYIAEVEREQFIETMSNRAWFVAGMFILSFLAIYIIVVFVIHLRINKRLDQLMLEMTAYARGITLPETIKSEDEIGELKKRFYIMRSQINQAQEIIAEEQDLKEQMVANISHDLKTPLTSIKAYAEAVGVNSDLSELEKEKYRQVILDKADYMQQMINDLNTHALLQSRTYKMDLVDVDGSEFFEMLLSGYDALCEKKHISLTVKQEVIGNYDVSPKHLMRVVDNLMMNAIRHTDDHGDILLAAVSQDIVDLPLYDYVKEQYAFNFDKEMYIIVQNNGDSIREEHIDRLFDPLYQVNVARTKTDDHGTGLGLTITKQIIEKHGGHVTALSSQSQGATFICSIPKKERRSVSEA